MSNHGSNNNYSRTSRSKNSMNHLSEDEALARALQMQYEREAVASRSSSSVPEASTTLRSHRVSTMADTGPSSSRNRTPMTVDEELARRLAAQEEAERASRAVEVAARPSSRGRNRSAVPAVHIYPETQPDTQPDGVVLPYGSSLQLQQQQQDEEFARRVEQELQDELVAERLQQKEQERLDREQQAYLQQQQQQPAAAAKRKLSCGTMIAITLAVGTAIALICYFVILGGSVPAIDLTPEDFAKEDPFDETRPEDANAWNNDGAGVKLSVINALETKWYQYFYDAVTDWESGYPDSLELETEFNAAGPDSACEAVNGKVKVCNGNYGNTRWKGINEVLIDGSGHIIASSARMNEYYLGADNDDEMQYTMCHELGHAWGLGHTDETFGNQDLGDCMDYTNNPQNNRQPTERNFVFLYKMYGLIPGAAPFTAPTPAPTFQPTPSGTVSSQASAVLPNGDRRRTHRQRRRGQALPQPEHTSLTRRNNKQDTILLAHDDKLPEWLIDAMHNVLDRHPGRRLQEDKWTALTTQSDNRGGLSSYETHLGYGFKLRVHYLS